MGCGVAIQTGKLPPLRLWLASGAREGVICAWWESERHPAIPIRASDMGPASEMDESVDESRETDKGKH